jgi:hypothetical protein
MDNLDPYTVCLENLRTGVLKATVYVAVPFQYVPMYTLKTRYARIGWPSVDRYPTADCTYCTG